MLTHNPPPASKQASAQCMRCDAMALLLLSSWGLIRPSDLSQGLEPGVTAQSVLRGQLDLIFFFLISLFRFFLPTTTDYSRKVLAGGCPHWAWLGIYGRNPQSLREGTPPNYLVDGEPGASCHASHCTALGDIFEHRVATVSFPPHLHARSPRCHGCQN